MTHQESLFSPTANFLLFYYVDLAVYMSGEGELLDMES